MTLGLERARSALVGDIGGTNARFALAAWSEGGALSLQAPQSLPTEDYDRLDDAIDAYLTAIERPAFDVIALACAGPVTAGRIAFTNLAWTAEADALRRRFGGRSAFLLNDLEAVAWAAPALEAPDVRAIGAPISGPPGGALAVLGAGTGVNASAWRRDEDGRAVVWSGEFGHAGFAPTDDLETEIWRLLRRRFGRVSVERVISGPGLLNIYQSLCLIQGRSCLCATPPEVSARAEAGEAAAQTAVEAFAAALGSAAGDVALTFGARGGVYIAGGFVSALLQGPCADRFRARFEDKGRLRAYLEQTPSYLILDPFAALAGAGRAALARVQAGL